MVRRATWMMVALGMVWTVSARAQSSPKPFELRDGEVETLNQEMTPGEMHRLLASLEGEWSYESTLWLIPDKPPMVVQGEASKHMILDGRFLEEVHESDFMGSPFEGRMVIGWDNQKKEFQATWMDNFGTGILVAHGRLGADGKTIELEAESVHPLTSRRETQRLVTRILDADHHVFESWAKPAGLPEYKKMETHFCRRTKG